MYDTMRFWVLLVNMATFVWFIALQYYRFKDSGRSCSGDFLAPGSLGFANPLEEHSEEKEKILGNAGHYLVVDQGFWFTIYIIMQYILYIICKIVAVITTNRLEAEFDEQKAQLGGMNF